MKRYPRVEDISPKEYELQVKSWLESSSSVLKSFATEHREIVCGMDGEYEIDIVVRFKAFEGAEFLMLVECKKHKNPIKRDIVQTLRQKQLSTGAHKAMVVSTSSFQKGAIEFAQTNGIALVELVSGSVAYIQNNVSELSAIPPEDAEDYAGIFYGLNKQLIPQPFTTKKNYGICEFLEHL